MTDTPYTEQDVRDAQWLVWFARKARGDAESIARRALDQNPALRFSEREAAHLDALTEAVEAKITQAHGEYDRMRDDVFAEARFDGMVAAYNAVLAILRGDNDEEQVRNQQVPGKGRIVSLRISNTDSFMSETQGLPSSEREQ